MWVDYRFEKVTIPCLSCVTEEHQTQELTQEVRLNDGMPDIGRVIAAWGQVVMRSKEWLTGTAKTSGGVMATVLYAPENGSEVRSVEAWIPYQIQWNIPETQLDGTLCIVPGLRFIDGRMSGARRILVRAGIYAFLDAFCPSEQVIFKPNNLPEDIQIRQLSCTGRIPKEAGEKTFLLDDDVKIPISDENPGKVLHCSLRPIIHESRVMTDKIVFRGSALLRLLHKEDNGKLRSYSFELPFSQFSELSGQFSPEAKVRVCPVTTSVELEGTDPQMLHLKCSIVAQYVVDELETLNVIDDIYSTRGELKPQTETLCRDVILKETQETFSPEVALHGISGTIVDAVPFMDFPRITNTDSGMAEDHSGAFKVLYYDKDEILQTAAGSWDERTEVPESMDCSCAVFDVPMGEVSVSQAGEECSLSIPIRTDLRISGRSEQTVIAGFEQKETESDVDHRPSLIICKPGEDTLWDIAKRYKSTIRDIERANNPDDNREADSFLLVPIPQ